MIAPAACLTSLTARARSGVVAVLVLLIAALSPLPLRAQGAATLIADQVFVDGQGRLIATGSVEVWHGSVRLRADRIVYDQRGNALDVQGNLVLSDGPDVVILADSAQLSQGMREGLITSARIMLNQQLQITAQRLERNAQGQSQMYEVLASSCPVCAESPTPLWEIRAARVSHDEAEGRLRFERAQFRFAGVPVFYAPRLSLPDPGNTRARGFLRPEVSSTSALGVMVGMPYFMPFGDDRDLTVTPRLSTQGSLSLGLRWRQAFERGGYEIGAQITRDDILPGRLRGYAYLRALFDVGQGFRLGANLMYTSDRSYLDTYNITDDARLSADVTLERLRRDQAIRLRALGFYSLRATDVNDELPNIALQGEIEQRIGLGHTPVGGELRVNLGADGFVRASSVDGVRGRDVARAHLQLGWRRTEVLAGGLLVTGAVDARLDHIRVHDDSAFAAPINRRALQGMLELRWPVARVSGSGARDVIEPVVQIIGADRTGRNGPNDDHTMPELDQGSLFALTRYSGQDARDDGSRVNAGLRWSRVAPGGTSAEAVIGRIWRDQPLGGFNAAHVQPLGRTESHWLLAGRLARGDALSYDARLLIDPATATLSRAETNLIWRTAGTDLTTRYLYMPASAFEDRAVTLSEWSVDIARRRATGWGSSIGWDYDVATRNFATARAGLMYRNDCLAFDMSVQRRFVSATNPRASTSFDLRLELLGIGGGAVTPSSRSCRG